MLIAAVMILGIFAIFAHRYWYAQHHDTASGSSAATSLRAPTPNGEKMDFVPPFYVKGNKIVDSKGVTVEIRGIAWFGFETKDHLVHGLWQRSAADMIAQMKSLGFNSIRLPFCPATLRDSKMEYFDTDLNPGLKKKKSLEAFDIIIKQLTDAGFYVLLDHHVPNCDEVIPDTPATDTYTLEQWMTDLEFVASRYKDNPRVIGLDLKTEPHGRARWGNGDIATDWKLQAETAGARVLRTNPNLLIFVEGIESNGGDCETVKDTFWGGNIEPVSCYPIDNTKIPRDRLVLSPHIYGPSVDEDQPYFKSSEFPANMPAIWEQQIGRFMGDYPVILGEFGGWYKGKDKLWQDAFITWLISKDVTNFYFWSYNPNSDDTGGIVGNDWKTVSEPKYNNLRRLFKP